MTVDNEVFDTITEYMKDRVGTLEFAKDYFDGFEYWFQIEVIAALQKGGIVTTIKDKMEFDSDIVIEIDSNRFGIELKAFKSSHSGDVIKSSFKHKRADYYLIISEKSDKIYEALEKSKKAGFYPKVNDIHDNWILIFGKNHQK